MKMNSAEKHLAIITSLFFVCFFAAFTEGKQPAEASFTGVNLLLSKRTGFFEYNDLDLLQDTLRKFSVLGGFSLGKRYTITKKINFQIAGTGNFGKITQDTIIPSDPAVIKYLIVNLALEPEIQFNLPKQENLYPYLFVGGGLNFLILKEKFFKADNSQNEILFQDVESKKYKHYCLSAICGMGLEFMLSPDVNLALRYSFRFWRPVEYEYDWEMDLLYPLKYYENFYSHMIQLLLVFSDRD